MTSSKKSLIKKSWKQKKSQNEKGRKELKAMSVPIEDYEHLDGSLHLGVDFSGEVSDVIAEVEKFMMERRADFISIKLTGRHRVDDLIRAGFMPIVITDNTAWIYQQDIWILIDHYIEGFKPESLKFWFEERYNTDPSLAIEDRAFYFYANIKGWKEFATRTGNSFPLLMYAKDQVYKSRRAKTDMLMFRQATSALYNRLEPHSQYMKLVVGASFRSKGIPVTRYAAGMSKGLYYNEDDNAETTSSEDATKAAKKFCGTFYYFEPESTTYLTFKTFVVFKNKHEAVMDLVGLTSIKYNTRIINRYYNDPANFPHPDLMMTPTEYVSLTTDMEDAESPYWLIPEDRKHYVGRHLDIYAAEDEYDQLICVAARDKGYDVVILTHMVGSFQLVTEVLDTRDRHISFSNLTFPG